LALSIVLGIEHGEAGFSRLLMTDRIDKIA